MGKYDIPAMIDHIIETTQQEKIFYIGHSMGTTGFMVMANDRPEYQDKVHLANFLAPVAVSWTRLKTLQSNMPGKTYLVFFGLCKGKI